MSEDLLTDGAPGNHMQVPGDSSRHGETPAGKTSANATAAQPDVYEPEYDVGVAVLYLAAILAIGIVIALVLQKWAIEAILIVSAGFAGMMYLVRRTVDQLMWEYELKLKRFENATGFRLRGRAPAKLVWFRDIVQLPLPRSVLADLNAHLVIIRKEAFDLIRLVRGETGLSMAAIRVNIFLPDSSAAEWGEAIALKTHPDLSLDLSADERQLVFRPMEGLTGLVFSIESPGGAVNVAAQGERHQWERVLFRKHAPLGDRREVFRMTELHSRLVDQDLRWILSWPLELQSPWTKSTEKAGAEDGEKPEHAVGVLNVDGKGFSLTEDQMSRVREGLEPAVGKAAQLLEKLPWQRVAVIVQNQ